MGAKPAGTHIIHDLVTRNMVTPVPKIPCQPPMRVDSLLSAKGKSREVRSGG